MESYICSLAVLIPSIIAVIYGFTVIIPKYKGLYFVAGVLAMVCLMSGHIAYSIGIFTGQSLNFGFYIDELGTVGSCLFFMTVNIGPLDRVSDDKSIKLRKYRILASLSPLVAAVIMTLCVYIMFKRNCFTGIVSAFIMTLFIMMPLYFCTKMAIIPDVKDGFLNCMRPYNFIVTLLGLLNILERGMRHLWLCDTLFETILMYLIYAMIGLCILSATVFLKRGAKRWMNI